VLQTYRPSTSIEARDAASPPAEWVFGDVMTRRQVRGDYRKASGSHVSDLKTFTTIQESVPHRFRDSRRHAVHARRRHGWLRQIEGLRWVGRVSRSLAVAGSSSQNLPA